MNVLITGGNGYIAKSLSKSLDNSISITRKDFDLTDRHATNKWFEGKHFDVVIHTAVKGGSRLLVDGGNVFYENGLRKIHFCFLGASLSASDANSQTREASPRCSNVLGSSKLNEPWPDTDMLSPMIATSGASVHILSKSTTNYL